MGKIVRYIPLLALAITSLAHADDTQPCDDGTVAAVARWAAIKGKLTSWNEQDGLIAATACKAMPNAPQITIAAIAFDTNHEGPGAENGSKVQVVALVEARKVIAADRSTIEEDAMTAVGSYRIDTAPYLLSPDVRAFGVVFSSSARGPGCPDASAEDELTLWIRDSDHLRPVFGTNLEGWTSTDSMSCGGGMEGARSESAHVTIAVEKTASHGFADLSLTAHVTQTRLRSGQYVDEAKRTARTVLKYDGKSYGIDMFRNFWYPAVCAVCSRTK
jgi:hypothetical protein